MREFMVIFLTILITRFITEGVFSWVGLEYSWFDGEFNPLSFLADFGIFIFVYTVIYYLLKKILIKKEES